MESGFIDMICFNEECKKIGNQLFLYKQRQKSIHRNHLCDCVNLHASNFDQKYANPTQIIQDFKYKYQSSLEGKIDQITESVVRMLKDVLNKQIMKTYDKGMQQFLEKNSQNRLEKIKTNKDRQYELMIINNLENKEAMKKIINKRMQKCQSEALQNLTQMNHHIIHEIQKIIPQFQPSNLNIIEQELDREILLPGSKPIKLQFEQMENRLQIQLSGSESIIIQPNQKHYQNENLNTYNISSNRNHSDIRNWLSKTKQIKKPNNLQKLDRMMNQFQNNPFHKRINSQTNKSSKKQITFFIIRSQADFISIQSNQQNIHKLIVYHYLNEQDLGKIIQRKSPKQIYINYPHQLSASFFRNIPEPILMQIQKFQDFWDHDQFFDERINLQFFPTDDFRHVKFVNKVHLIQKSLNSLQKLTNIWISTKFDLDQLKLSKKKPSSIKSLRIEICRCCHSLNQQTISQILNYFKQVDSLRTFVLKCQKLNANNLFLLRQFTKTNNKIQCLYIEIEGKAIPRQMIQCFAHLPLTKLAINKENINEKCNVYMDVTPITLIKSLKKLALINIFFTTKLPTYIEIEQEEYIQLDEQASYKICSLHNLVFLDLFRCSPIYTSVVSQLSEQSQSNLYHLNLSYSCMDQALIAQLYNLPKLKQLNLDRTQLNLQSLFNQLLKKPLYNIQQLSLFQYNGDALDQVDEIRDFQSNITFSAITDSQIQKISICFPNLNYLNIAFCYQFTNLPQSKFNNLKYLCSNKQYMTASKIEKLKLQRGIEVYLYDGKHPADHPNWATVKRHKKQIKKQY